MSEILMIYSSTDGQTKKICERIKEFSKKTNKIRIITIDKASDENLKQYKEIIIGASIRYGKHNKKIYSFVKKNKEILNLKKTAFFSVNVVARKLKKNTPDTNPYVLKFLEKSAWKPDRIAVFAGKIDYPNYSFLIN